ncbi:MAG TPA: hypothetical protein VG347_20565 [Verrucomicrobiae bacterium]|nr:hypothetical protein [Verrucomicrobiae bacterium]
MEKCVFTGDISLFAGHIAELDMVGTQIKSLSGSRLNVEQSLNLNDGFVANGEVNLQNAVIGGDLSCEESLFENANGMAISADGIKVNGSVMLRNNFSSIGEVRFVDSTVGGIIDCESGSFKNINGSGCALNFTRAKIERALSMRNSIFDGRVSMENALIGGANVVQGRKIHQPSVRYTGVGWC